MGNVADEIALQHKRNRNGRILLPSLNSMNGERPKDDFALLVDFVKAASTSSSVTGSSSSCLSCAQPCLETNEVWFLV